MKNETKTRIMSGIVSIALAAGISLSSPSNVWAEGVPTQGTVIEQTQENEEHKFNEYEVVKGDNTSKISKKICKLFNEEPTTKYWPVIAFLNNYPRMIKPGDVIIFPDSFEDMDNLLNALRESGWTSKYIQANDIYGKRNNVNNMTIGQIIASIYGDSACADPDFVNNYLSLIGLGGNYNIDTIVDDNNLLFALTDWIPDIDEVLNHKVSNKKIKK